jgi:hypothetical protein
MCHSHAIDGTTGQFGLAIGPLSLDVGATARWSWLAAPVQPTINAVPDQSPWFVTHTKSVTKTS